MSTRVRRARPDEAADLTALCLRSKAHWGYDAAFMALAAPALAVTPAMIAEGSVFVATAGDDHPLGVARLVLRDDLADLDLFFIAPEAVGRGVGRALFTYARDQARRRRCRRMTILSDPGAVPFYLKMGARLAGEAPSDAVPGRRLPVLSLDL